MRMLIALLALSLAAISHAENYRIPGLPENYRFNLYRLNIIRVGDNLYRSSYVEIATRNCHANLQMEDVILNFNTDDPTYNMIVNAKSEYCPVSEVRRLADIQ